MSTTKIQQREAQHFCQRKSQCPKPCQVHSPTLEEIQSMSFTDYVRNVILAREQVYGEGDGDKNKRSKGHDGDDGRFADKEPEPYKEGMAKVVLPNGFSEERGIAQDRTGRGIPWQEGSPLGDYIISSPIKQCIQGIGGIYEYTFLDQPALTVSEFREKADEYARKNNAGEISVPSNDDNKSDEDYFEMIQRKFWKRLCPTMPPSMYGADMEGSLFSPEDPASGWNFGKINSCLHVLGKVPGVTSPYLYFGMWASVFAAHSEDMNLLSVNYLHAGAPKIWYAIAPGHDSKRFEALAQGYFPDAFNECGEFLRHKRYLLSPTILQKAGIPFTVQIQRPGDAIITLPSGYHFGFNTGFNIAEATNFGVPEWIPYGIQARICKCRPDSVTIDMNVFQRVLLRYERDTRDKDMSWREWGIINTTARKENSKAKTTTKRQSNKQQREKSKTIAKVKGKAKAITSKQQQRSSSLNEKKKSQRGSPVKDRNKRSKSSSPIKKSSKSTEKRPKLSVQEQKHEFWVEVMQTALRRKIGRKKKRGGPKQQQEEELWHLAKPALMKSLQPQTRVLYMRPSWSSMEDKFLGNSPVGEEEDGDDEQCFLGVIVEIVDGHGKIHFDGLPKKDDIWVPLSSKKMFLDGGKWDENSSLPNNHYWKEMDSKTME